MNNTELNTNGKDFSFNNIKDFDNHINKSIPAYNTLIELILSISGYFIHNVDSLQVTHNIVDIGCSTGNLLKQLRKKYNNFNGRFFGYDISENLLPDNDYDNSLYFQNKNVLDKYTNFDNSNLILSIFTLQFIEINKRQNLLNKIYNDLNFGGAFIIAEKNYSDKGIIQDIFNFSHYDHKLKSFTEKDLLDKQKILRNIMPLIPEKTLIEMLQLSGFTVINKFWQALNFNAFICIKL